MPRLQLQDGSLISYQSTGDGFPLILLPGPEGMAGWLPHMPLLGELCHAVAYERCEPQPAVDLLPALLHVFQIQRMYLASPAPGWASALEFARRHPNAIEALLLVDFPGSSAEARPLSPTFAAPASDMALPTLILLADDASPARPAADCLSAHLPDCRTVIMGGPGQDQPALPKSPRRRFPHLMMQFLLDRERHRNLVRGASFLL